MRGIALLSLALAHWLLLGGPPASAAAPELHLVLAPSRLRLAVGESAVVDVLATLPAGTTMGDVLLSPVPSPYLSVGTPDPRPLRPATGWRLTVTMLSSAPTSHELVFTARREGSPRAVLAHLAVEPRAPRSPTEILRVSVVAAQQELNEEQPVFMYVTIQNVASVPVTIRRVQGRASSGLKVCGTSGVSASGPACPSDRPTGRAGPALAVRSIRPGEATLVSFRIDATGQARAGDQSVVFDGAGDYVENAVTRQVAFVATHGVRYAVLGESSLLTAIGVPSFLVLPGFLALMSYRLVARRYNTVEGAISTLDVSAPEFLTLSTTLSVLAIPVFWAVTWLLGDAHTYLGGYGVRDLVAVWMGSVVVGLLSFGFPRLVLLLRENRRTPRPTDTPRRLLSRLGAAGASVILPRVRVTWGGPGGTQANQFYRVGTRSPSDDRVWLVPGVHYSFAPEATDTDIERVRAALEGAASAAAVLGVIRRTPVVDLAWAPGPVTGPLLVDETRVVEELQPAALLQQSAASGEAR
ncbi:hypothetical protein GCM10017673_14180 [Streptosporangium violaceochromogenes]|nr:hypothetical protein GCM10017673_14180 [Streptosporangium violaceochromogenes]